MAQSARAERTARDGGFALIAVAIATAALSLMIAAVGAAAHRHVNEARDSIARVKMNAAIDGALTTVAARLAAERLTAEIFAHPQTVTVGSVAVTVSVRPESSKIDLNAAPPDMLTDLFRAVGASSERALKLSGAIADWRDDDGFAGANGGEAADYLSAGRSYTPANRNLESVAELGLVLGADDALVRCVAADVTVFTNLTSVDVAYASPHVRTSLGLGTDGGTQISDDGIEVQPGAIFELVARVSADGQDISRAMIVRVTGDSRNPIWTLANVAPAPSRSESDAACREFAANTTASP